MLKVKAKLKSSASYFSFKPCKLITRISAGSNFDLHHPTLAMMFGGGVVSPWCAVPGRRGRAG